ncbi:reverse transcriptase [Tanacetum coccineum]|uniref:Reverse transcriptase n=1 Tax=Tanacetum coccineum TaxID=301880 RepID=A0ABQ5IXH3_9ASTR
MNSTAALDVVARDSTCSLIYVDGMPCSSMSHLHAEVLVVHYACQLAFRRGWSQAIVECDCQTAITLSSTKTIPPWNFAGLVTNIRSWLTNLQLSSHGLSVKTTKLLTGLLALHIPFMNSTAALDVVARDSTCSLIYVDGMPCSSMSHLHAEVLVVHYAGQLAFRRGWSQAIVESDCQTAITLSSTKTITPWNFAGLVNNIRSWSTNLQLSFSWTKRENNKVAHWVARFAYSSALPFR